MKINMKKDEKEPSYSDYVNIYSSTQGLNKNWNYFLSIINLEAADCTIRALRKVFGIPINGLKYQEGFDQSLYPHQEIRDCLHELLDYYGLNPIEWDRAMEDYFYFGNLERPCYAFNDMGLCIVVDIAEDKKDPFGEYVTKFTDKTYPLAIRFSQYASQRDLIDFIKKTYRKVIAPVQKKYKDSKVKIGKLKTRKKLERDEFIFKHQNLSRKELAKLVKEQLGAIGNVGKGGPTYSDTSSILSREKRRRGIKNDKK